MEKDSSTIPRIALLNFSFSFFCYIIISKYTGSAALPDIQLSLYLCPAMALVAHIIKTPGSFLRLLPVDMAISSAPVLTGAKSQVSRRQ